MQQSSRKILTKEDVVSIFLRKPCPGMIGDHSNRATATTIANAFGVSAKTVRDIWIGRTWYKETLSLDPTRIDAPERLARRIGRPKGAKDTKPRRRKTTNCSSSNQLLNLRIVQSLQCPYNSNAEASRAARLNNYSDRTDAGTGSLPDQPVESRIRQLPPYLISGLCEEYVDPFHGDWALWPSRDESSAQAHHLLINVEDCGPG